MGWDKHDTSWDGSESMDSTITHGLDGMGQARHVVRQQRKDGFNDHSHTGWDGTSTIRRETAAKAWIRRSLTT